MSLASAVSAWQAGSACTTLRQFRRALLVALLAVGAGCLIYAIEKFVLTPQRRFVENPTDVVMRAFGLAHFWVGWLFLFTSPQLRNRSALVRLLLCTLAGVAIAVLFGQLGGRRSLFVLMAFYSYFLVHEIRDEAGLFTAYGDAPAGHADNRKLLAWLSATAALAAMTLLVAAFSLHGSAGERAVAYTTRPGLLLALGIVLLAAASVWAGTRTLRLGCRIHGDVRSVLAAHQPLLVVYGGLLGLLLLGVVLGSVGFNLIILVHVTAWLVFVYHQLKKRPPVPARNLWTWLRATPAGFLTLHLGLVLLILVLMALRVHVWERAGLVSELFASANFHYWSVMHISMAFWRSRN